MKYFKLTITLILVTIFTNVINAQTELPEPPEPPKLGEGFNFFKMNKEKEDKLLKNLAPDLVKQLKEIKKYKSDKYFQLLMESQYKNLKFPYLQKKDKLIIEKEQSIFADEVKTEALVATYKNTKGNKKASIKKELRSTLNKLFQAKEERRKLEVEELRRELDELQKSLEVRKRNKQKIIERRLEELLDEDEYFEWD